MQVDKITNEDCFTLLKRLPSRSVDLVVTDPPYNIGLSYDVYVDRLPAEKYLEWCKTWLEQCARILKPTASLYLINYPETNAQLFPYLNQKLIFRRWLTWHYPTNTGSSVRNYTRTQRSILFYTKTDNYIFNWEAVAQPYRNPHDKRIKELLSQGRSGCAPYDFLQFNQVKNISTEKTQHPCQLPELLVESLVKASSKPGQLVLDPFCGSGTVPFVAKRLKRHFLSCDLSKSYCQIARARLSKIK